MPWGPNLLPMMIGPDRDLPFFTDMGDLLMAPPVSPKVLVASLQNRAGDVYPLLQNYLHPKQFNYLGVIKQNQLQVHGKLDDAFKSN